MSRRILWKFLEDPDHPLVGPHLKLLSFVGLWSSNLKSPFSKFKQFLFYTIISFFFSQYIKCCLNFNPDALKLILQYAPFHMGILKSCLFRKDFEKWKNLIEYISSTEKNQLEKDDTKSVEIINKYVTRSRRVTYFFWALAFFSNFGIFSEPYQKNQINENGTSLYLCIFDGFTPFSREPPGYYISMCIQTVLGNVVSVYVVGWDTLVVSIMIYFAGQLKISRMYCTHAIIAANPVKSHESIAKCHQFHVNLIKHQKLFNRLISSVMFVYLIVVSVNLGVCIIQIVQIQDDLRTLISSCFFVLACLIQLLLFYWHSNEVTVESTFSSYSTFESDWPNSIKKLQKETVLLGITTRKRLVFKAGPFHEMSLPTFIGILRTSYSFYTLLNTTN